MVSHNTVLASFLCPGVSVHQCWQRTASLGVMSRSNPRSLYSGLNPYAGLVPKTRLVEQMSTSTIALCVAICSSVSNLLDMSSPSLQNMSKIWLLSSASGFDVLDISIVSFGGTPHLVFLLAARAYMCVVCAAGLLLTVLVALTRLCTNSTCFRCLSVASVCFF